MFAFVIALIILAAAVGAVYLILKNMGEDGIEVAAPGSCKSGRCGVRGPVTEARDEQEKDAIEEDAINAADEQKRKEAA